MAATVQALIDAGPKLTHVGILVLLIFLCFGILGSQLFSGSLRQRCHVYVDGFGLLLTDAVVAYVNTTRSAMKMATGMKSHAANRPDKVT